MPRALQLFSRISCPPFSTAPRWDFVSLEFVQDCACCHNWYEFICKTTLLCLENILSLKLSFVSSSDNLTYTKINKCFGEGCYVPFRAELSISLHIDQLRVYVLIVIYCKKSLWWGLTHTLINMHNNKSLEIILLQCTLSRIIQLHFHLEPMTCLGFSSCQVWVPSHGINLRFSKKVTEHKIHATLYQWAYRGSPINIVISRVQSSWDW